MLCLIIVEISALIIVEICALFDYCGDLCFVCMLWRPVH